MKLAVMQPYFFPYIGYFQLINSVDKFIFYDDVNFIKNGWINRNRILINGEPSYLTLELKYASPNKSIKEIKFSDNRLKLKRTLEFTYKKAPFFNEIRQIIDNILSIETESVCEIAIESIIQLCNYLDLKVSFERSSIEYSQTKNLDKAKRLIEICRLNNSDTYINPIGGMELYQKSYFENEGVDLKFIQPKFICYKQYNNEFVPWLSIIDVLMFNGKDKTRSMLDEFELI